jgi:hypothetical protein
MAYEQLRALLLLICLFGGIAGVGVGIARRDLGGTMLGLLVIVASILGLS